MKGLIVATLGEPSVVRGDWNDNTMVAGLLDCESFLVVKVPTETPPPLSMFFDADGAASGRDVNALATELVADQLHPGRYVAGPALIAGFDTETGDVADLNLLDLIRIGARLVRAERAALPRGDRPQ